MRGSWEDVFLSCEGLAGKLLADHLLRDGSRQEEEICSGNKSWYPLP